MLQQTQVETVLTAYRRWMAKFPTLLSLAEADESEVLSLWAGLGYYRRARNLLAAAKAVAQTKGGQLPGNREELLALPGIGEYTAGAVLSLAMGKPEPILDGNVARVLSRFYALPLNMENPVQKKRLWELARLWATDEDPGKVNEALMELGAMICQPRKALCHACPLRETCRAYALEAVDRFPPPKAKIQYQDKRGIALVISHDGEWLILPMPAGDLLQGHALFPILWGDFSARTLRAQVAEAWPQTRGALWEESAASITHSITRYRISLDLYRLQVDKRGKWPAGHLWLDPDRLKEFLVPSLGHKIWRAARKGASELRLG